MQGPLSQQCRWEGGMEWLPHGMMESKSLVDTVNLTNPPLLEAED